MPCCVGKSGELCDSDAVLRVSRKKRFILLTANASNVRMRSACFTGRDAGGTHSVCSFVTYGSIAMAGVCSGMDSSSVMGPNSSYSLNFAHPTHRCVIEGVIKSAGYGLFRVKSRATSSVRSLCISGVCILNTGGTNFSVSAGSNNRIGGICLGDNGANPVRSHSMVHHAETPFFVSVSGHKHMLKTSITPFAFARGKIMHGRLLMAGSGVKRMRGVIVYKISVRRICNNDSFHNSH